jgi:hypothetical protein
MRFFRGRWFKSSVKTPTNVPELSCFSLNVNGLNQLTKRSHLASMRRVHDWSILSLPDTRLHHEKGQTNLLKSIMNAKKLCGV